MCLRPGWHLVAIMGSACSPLCPRKAGRQNAAKLDSADHVTFLAKGVWLPQTGGRRGGAFTSPTPAPPADPKLLLASLLSRSLRLFSVLVPCPWAWARSRASAPGTGSLWGHRRRPWGSLSSLLIFVALGTEPPKCTRSTLSISLGVSKNKVSTCY